MVGRNNLNYEYCIMTLQINKGELLAKIADIREEYTDVVKEAQAIQEAQKVKK